LAWNDPVAVIYFFSTIFLFFPLKHNHEDFEMEAAEVQIVLKEVNQSMNVE